MKIHTFGSLSTGLALESSDLDLVITGLDIEGREDVVEHIRIIQEYFENSEYFSSVKAIEGASVPVIKLQADLQKVRENLNSSRKIEVESKMRFLQIDVTFDDSKQTKADSFWEGGHWNQSKIHLGMKSVHLVKTYIKEYVHLRELTL